MKPIPNIKIFSDFDATIAQKDIGDEFFIQYGNLINLLPRLKNRELNIFQYWTELLKSLPKNIDKDFLSFFATQFDIDPYFKNFYETCKNYTISFSIVSDGVIEYIEPFLIKENFSDIMVYSNRLDFSSYPIKPIFPFATESGNPFSAVSKEAVILNQSEENDVLIFIGDGISDFGAAKVSDYIFAKDELARFCSQEKLPHYNYKSFFDINQILIKLLNSGSIKKRRQSQLAAKFIFEQE